ncbi:serine hydrolase domain-containing protein [Rhodococcoides fascians]|uniref:serine hydrolase domain-containing protein n=1 Tax=Rhodococcoides fascians TaxID=1828 RepID=UPI001E42F729|nr:MULTISPECIES: serine hydrolase domain-containing protein [Rhodococcus]
MATVAAGTRRLAVGLLMTLTFLLGLTPGPAAAVTLSNTDLQNAVDEWAAEIGAPGMSVQVLDSDTVVGEASNGVDGNGEPVDASTPFVWGSVSKQFTAATVLGLERQGVFDESTPVVDIVPGARNMLGDPATSVGDLMHHTSGLPHDITVTDDWSRRGSAVDAIATIPQPVGTTERGSFRYSSLNYMLLQAVVETVTGESFADALDAQVLSPADTSAITDPEQFTDDVPPGHVPFFGSARPIDVGVDSAGLGYGYLAGSTGDLGRYASWRLSRLQGGEDTAPEVDTGEGTEYGDGLFHEKIAGQDVWWHSGAVPGYYAYVAFVPALDRAMVLATNRYGEIEAEHIAAVGRNLTTLVIDGSTTGLPSSSAPMVLGTIFAAVAVLLAIVVWVTVRLFTGQVRQRSLGGAALRIAITTVLGGSVLIGAYIGVPTIVGASLSVMALWAPDVTLAFWILLGTVFLASALVVTDQVVNYGRIRQT